MDKADSLAQALNIDGHSLTIEQLVEVARNYRDVALETEARDLVHKAELELRELATMQKPIYGVNTGLGIFANCKIQASQSLQLSRNLILSHAVGLGEPFPEDVVRSAMLIRANTLAKGHSGVRPELIDLLLEMLNSNLTPFIPSQGSLGSSGDLAPLAHLALVLSTDPTSDVDSTSGKAWHSGSLMSGKKAMHSAGLKRLILHAKEGLAIINGATFATALLALACYDAKILLRLAEISASLSMEALLCVSNALDSRLHEARPHPGQMVVAERLRAILDSSTLVDSTERVQDAYSIRCTPQVLGPVWDLLDFIQPTVSREMNASTDNPLIFNCEAISGGNFHGEPIGLASDYLKIALAEVGALAERRIYRLVAEHTNEGLAPMLVMNPEDVGLQSGLMMLQYSAASLVLENQSLAFPASVSSLPTSAGQEDHNANATLAARYLFKVVNNLYHIISIELLISAQALDLRLRGLPEAKLGTGSNAAYDWVRSIFPPREDDYPLSEDVLAMVDLLKNQELLSLVDNAIS
jgi:histidine ammonia-lyase